jgi:hypothetical protein
MDSLSPTIEAAEAQPAAAVSPESRAVVSAAESAAAWPVSRRLLWIALLACSCYAYGGGLTRELTAPGRKIADFFQEWASARNYFTGRAIYTPQRETAQTYLNYTARPQDFFVEINGHPPTAVVLALPFGLLDYNAGFLLWNWLSVVAVVGSAALVMRETEMRFSAWALLPALALLIGNPLLQHLACGQLGGFLLLLITGAWLCDRRGHSGWAGAILAVATAVKLFPGFLFLYFVWKGKWRTVFVGAATFFAVVGLTAAILGTQSFVDFVQHAMPEVGKYRRTWANASLDGFFTRLLSAESDRAIPLIAGRWLPKIAYVFSAATLIGTLGLLTRRSRTREADDFAYGLHITAMLLVSPITWDHYFLLLTQPILLVAYHLAKEDGLRRFLTPSIFLMWLNPLFLWTLFLGADLITVFSIVSSTQKNIFIVSLPFYALVTMFTITAAVTGRTIAEPKAPSDSRRSV